MPSPAQELYVDNLSPTAEQSGTPYVFRRALRFFYIQAFSYDFIFGYAIFPAYFQLQGTSPEIIGAILAFWAAGIIVFEIPAGLLADLVDRRLLLILSPVAKATCFVIWIFADGDVLLYFVGMAFWSLASALRTGTKEALLFDLVHTYGQASRYTAIVGRERALQEAATLLGAALGGLVVAIDLKLAFWTSLIPLGVCMIAAGLVHDPRGRPEVSEHVPLKQVPHLLRSTWQEFVTVPEARHLTLYVALCVTFLTTIEDFNQLFMLAVGTPVWLIGLIVGAIGVARLTLAYHAHWFERFPAITWSAPLVSGLALIASGFLPPIFALLAMAGAFILVAPLLVLTTSRFQKALGGASRATTTSVMSAIIEGLSVVFNIAIAVLLSQLDVLQTYQAGGIYLVIFAAWEITQARRPGSAARTANAP
ncbi:MAG: MFS transporter [Burkholderiales bacterium]|nr:MAG: MFS transporter [Burkholderiales bacterium]